MDKSKLKWKLAVQMLVLFGVCCLIVYGATKLLPVPSWWWVFYIISGLLVARVFQMGLKDINAVGEVEDFRMTACIVVGIIASFAAWLLPLTLLILLFIYLDSKYFFLLPGNRPEASRKREQKESEIKKRLGLKESEIYLTFQKMGGVGTIKCNDCGHVETEVISFEHGANSCYIGRQCPKCYALVAEYNESETYHTFGDAKEDFHCPKCGTLIRKKEESIFKGNEDPLFCPKCHSPRLGFWMDYIT